MVVVLCAINLRVGVLWCRLCYFVMYNKAYRASHAGYVQAMHVLHKIHSQHVSSPASISALRGQVITTTLGLTPHLVHAW
jgi:hypothetical protein